MPAIIKIKIIYFFICPQYTIIDYKTQILYTEKIIHLPGCGVTVARVFWEDLVRVQISAARLRVAEATLRRGEGPMRDWYSGIMSPFQGEEAGSIPVSRFH